MKKLAVLILTLLVTTATFAGVPSGRFKQDIQGGFRDIHIAKDGHRAQWITKACVRCRVIWEKLQPIYQKDQNSFEFEGHTYQIESDRTLFHPSMGTFAKD